MNKQFKIIALVTLLGVGWTNATLATPIYQVSGGQLTGIQNIDVDGIFYDVEFKEGSFNSIFGTTSNLAFTTMPDAFLATTALLAALVDGGGGLQLDTNPDTIFGCEASSECYIMTPSSDFVNVVGNLLFAATLRNGSSEILDSDVQLFEVELTYDMSTDPDITYADWSLRKIPEPATLALMSLGLAGLGFVCRKKS